MIVDGPSPGVTEVDDGRANSPLLWAGCTSEDGSGLGPDLGADRRGEPGDAHVRDDDPGAGNVGGLAAPVADHAHRHGGDRGVVETGVAHPGARVAVAARQSAAPRSEERRVGKECRCRESASPYKKGNDIEQA